MVDPANRADVAPEHVEEALGLTRTESRVAVLLAQVGSIDAVAAATGRRRTTVKWHLLNIYAKLGIDGRLELTRLVTSLADLPPMRS